MKKLYTLILSLLIAQYTFAQWPENYGGVMLQAFYWNSYEDTQWTKLTEQADELSTYFDVIWVPNSSWCTDGKSMGYDPVYWFRHNSSFGQLRELKNMISTYKAKNVSIIGDVVINHKKPLGNKVEHQGEMVASWIDFASESITMGGTKYTITWSGADICKDDDGGDTAAKGWPVTGANDTGTDFGGFRDLDHKSANVQNNVKLYLRYLLEGIGYDGFRLDMVKGYGGEFTKIYNEAVNPKFCVGEYWDGYDAITYWMNSTGKTSAAFDFPLKYQLNKACGEGNWGALSDKGIAGNPYWSRYAVTFIDNHDTYRDYNKLAANELAANAFILAMPGTPCIFLKHWQNYSTAIGRMILARKACGITNQSSITKQMQSGNGYVIEVQGSKGSVLCLMGYPNYDTNGFKMIVNGANFAYYVSNNVPIEPLPIEIPECVKPIEGHLYCYFQANSDYPTPYAWVWGAGDKNFNINSTWPGDKMTKVGTDNSNHDIYLWDGGELKAEMPTGVLFSNNKTPQTDDFQFVNGGYYDVSGKIGEATGIVAPIADGSSKLPKTTYTMTGQRATDSYRGIVIQNGKKVLKK